MRRLRKITAARIWGIIRHLVAAGLVTLGDKGYHGAGYSSTGGNLRKCTARGIPFSRRARRLQVLPWKRLHQSVAPGCGGRPSRLAVEFGAPAKGRRGFVVAEEFDCGGVEEAGGGIDFGAGKRPREAGRVAFGGGLLGRVGDDQEGAAGGDQAWQHGQGGRTGGAVEWLDGVDLHDEVEGAPPRDGRVQQVARGVVDWRAREAAACAVDRGGGDVEGDDAEAEARDELGVVAETAADDQGGTAGAAQRTVSGPPHQVRVGGEAGPGDRGLALCRRLVEQLEPAGGVAGRGRLGGQLPGLGA